ncbi:hypothetical protein GUK30_32815 [Rhizobium leguminosarum]|uniref:hypothetical protein n=1 Tax=Rhizobium ruizarguesonis TaxID=2081791 RepID=UPI0013BF2F4C|nr:hypothetical protein [Rhizobium ruizarguesonis]NEI24130.1 hypothetical protein [Rhizobium ruizarguesonis]
MADKVWVQTAQARLRQAAAREGMAGKSAVILRQRAQCTGGGYRMKFISRVMLAAFFTSVCISGASAASKSLECQRYTDPTPTSPVQMRENVYLFTLHADYDSKTLRITLKDEPKGEKSGAYRFPVAVGDWRIIWNSPDDLRAVATITDYSDNPFDEPVQIMDVDFARVSVNYRETGRFQEFNTLDTAPWKYECYRLD